MSRRRRWLRSRSDERVPYVVLVLAHDRPEHLRRALASLVAAEGSERVPIVVSQDGESDEVCAVIESCALPTRRIVHTDRPPEQGDGFPSPVHGYRCIAAHYRWALNRVFDSWPAEAVVVIEDDLVVAPDVLQFFDACVGLLLDDPTILALSAWNDNGLPELVRDAARVVRSDWFPNLGVAFSRSLWAELEPDWPELYWDDWLRHPDRRRGRATLRPEVSRVRHTGAEGASFGQYFDEHTGRVVLPERADGFGGLDPEALREPAYGRAYRSRVDAATPVGLHDADTVRGDRRVSYASHAEFSALAGQLGLMADVRHDTPRTAYRGIVECRRGDDLLFLVPESEPADPGRAERGQPGSWGAMRLGRHARRDGPDGGALEPPGRRSSSP